eukprot:3899842-Rhodomonas_salina.4
MSELPTCSAPSATPSFHVSRTPVHDARPDRILSLTRTFSSPTVTAHTHALNTSGGQTVQRLSLSSHDVTTARFSTLNPQPSSALNPDP